MGWDFSLEPLAIETGETWLYKNTEMIKMFQVETSQEKEERLHEVKLEMWKEFVNSIILFFRWSGEAAQRLQAKPGVATETWKQILSSCLSHSGQALKTDSRKPNRKGRCQTKKYGYWPDLLAVKDPLFLKTYFEKKSQIDPIPFYLV